MVGSENDRNFDVIKIRHELQSLIHGNGGEEQEDIIQTIAGYLGRSKAASTGIEKIEYSKEQEAKALKGFIRSNSLWYTKGISEDHKIGEGAEQKVYYFPETQTVIKLNDSIYFLYWRDYLHNLMLHNYFFPSIGYILRGFVERNGALYAVVEQPFVRATDRIDLENVKEFLRQNGFENTRNNDYYNKQLGVILEDLHDENVISSGEELYFIDKVFYLTVDFYK